MRRNIVTMVAAGLLLAAAGCSQPYGPGYGPGPGMMRGDGPANARGGYGMYGMMGDAGPGGYGMGPGMMGGDGAGPGYGSGGYGMGPGMMGAYGPGMGPGMMGGYGPEIYGPDFTDEQRTKIAEIQNEFGRKQWALMEKMRAVGGTPGDGKYDEQAARKAYDAMADLRKQMFENSLEARKRMDGLLTPKQREQFGRGWGGRRPGAG